MLDQKRTGILFEDERPAHPAVELVQRLRRIVKPELDLVAAWVARKALPLAPLVTRKKQETVREPLDERAAHLEGDGRRVGDAVRRIEGGGPCDGLHAVVS